MLGMRSSCVARRLVAGLATLSLLVGVSAMQPASVAAAYEEIGPLDVPLFRQTDSLWAANKLGTCTSTIGTMGCAVTSMAMVHAYYGISVQGRSTGGYNDSGWGMSPAILNYWLTYRKSGGFTNGCEINWRAQPSGMTLLGILSGTRAQITSELELGRPVIAWVTSSTQPMHFVVITGQKSDGNYYINDPGSTATTLSPRYTLNGIRTFAPTNPTVTVDESLSRNFAWWDIPAANSIRTWGYAAHMSWAHTIASSSGGQVVTGIWSGRVRVPGKYTVYVWVARGNAGTNNAQYDVQYGPGPYGVPYQATSTVRQYIYNDQWIALGTWSFQPGMYSVTLDNITGETGVDIAYDAVKWVKVGEL